MPPGAEFVDEVEPALKLPVGDEAAAWADAEQAIRDRFGARLSDDDIADLVPYVMQTLRRSAELEAVDLTTDDPRSTAYTAEPGGSS